MTRIIGGLVGSRKLASPAKSTRPTSDRIRESIFNSLESKGVLPDSRVLDLYAGTGALGLESLSRGAKTALLVDSNKMAAAVCIKNSRLIEDALKDQIQSVQGFLDGSTGMFDVVFIDPPYEVSNAEVEKCLASLRERVTTGSWVLVERSARVDPFALDGYKLSEQKNFGDTVVYWLVPS